MAIVGSTQFLERIQFFNGERLFAADLQAIEAFNREMRWLHNQSLHQPGVGSGYVVTGNIGDSQVVISPGYALDSCGHEIILTESFTLPIPPVADNGNGASAFYDLTVSYPTDSELKPSETRIGICSPTPGVVRLREEPVFCWVQLGDDPTNRQPVDQTLRNRIKTGRFIVLAQVEIFNCKLKQPVVSVPRRNARPPELPRVACGTQTGGAGWTLSSPFGQPLPKPTDFFPGFGSLMYSLAVDTTSGRFQKTPLYVARLAGPREFVTAPPAGYDPQAFIADALINIPDAASPTPPTPQSFTVQVFPLYAPTIEDVFVADITSAVGQWNVVWMGVED